MRDSGNVQDHQLTSTTVRRRWENFYTHCWKGMKCCLSSSSVFPCAMSVTSITAGTRGRLNQLLQHLGCTFNKAGNRFGADSPPAARTNFSIIRLRWLSERLPAQTGKCSPSLWFRSICWKPFLIKAAKGGKKIPPKTSKPISLVLRRACSHFLGQKAGVPAPFSTRAPRFHASRRSRKDGGHGWR